MAGLVKEDDTGRGFTLIFVPHRGRPGRQIDVRGKGLVLFAALVVSALALLFAAGWLTISGAVGRGEVDLLNERIRELEDSLLIVDGYRRRLEVIETELGDLRDSRRRIENILCLVPGEPQDSSAVEAGE